MSGGTRARDANLQHGGQQVEQLLLDGHVRCSQSCVDPRENRFQVFFVDFGAFCRSLDDEAQ